VLQHAEQDLCLASARRLIRNGGYQMSDTLYPKPTKALADKRRDLAPDAEAAFRAFSEAVFKDGALPRKTKQLNCRWRRPCHAMSLLHSEPY
jgi:hypothetical protein